MLDFWNSRPQYPAMLRKPAPTARGRKALEAVSSPARLEIITVLGSGPATTKELAERLGRSRQSLYYHLDQLISAGLVVAEAADDDAREQRFRLRDERVTVGADVRARPERVAATNAANALLRTAGREVAAAHAEAAARGTRSIGPILVGRGKGRLSETQLRRATALIEELFALFSPVDDPTGPPFYSLTIALTPARTSAGARRR
jgi:DNA-binding transcriptional ArsR family regulator